MGKEIQHIEMYIKMLYNLYNKVKKGEITICLQESLAEQLF